MYNAAMKKLDATNRKILEILQDNGAITNSDLAGLIGLSAASTLERVKKLEKNGFITQYVALVDPEKVGKGLTAFMEISIADHSSEALQVFLDAISTIPEILECHHITGEKDYILKVVTEDVQSYEKLAVEKVAKIPHIGRVNTMIVLSTKKQLTAIPLNS